MKQLLLSAVTAAIVSFIAFQWLATEPLSDSAAAFDAGQPNRPSIEPARPVFSVTDALLEDTWVDASRTAGSDQRTLTDASTSMCYLTKVEISGVQGPDDTNSCAVEIDDFTGFWQLIATVEEGGRSEVRCNARCLSWNSRGTE